MTMFTEELPWLQGRDKDSSWAGDLRLAGLETPGVTGEKSPPYSPAAPVGRWVASEIRTLPGDATPYQRLPRIGDFRSPRTIGHPRNVRSDRADVGARWLGV